MFVLNIYVVFLGECGGKLDNYDVFVGEELRSCDINYDWGNVKI